jgi:hypothetical protein
MSFERANPETYFASKEAAGDVHSFIYGGTNRPQTFQIDTNLLIVVISALTLAFMAFLVYMKGDKHV